jgi:hypothetical protein
MDAETVAKLTGNALEKRGFCFWKCEALDGEVIAIVKGTQNTFFRDRARDHANQLIQKGILKEIPVIYTIEELQILADSLTKKLIHESKKWDREGTLIPDKDNSI